MFHFELGGGVGGVAVVSCLPKKKKKKKNVACPSLQTFQGRLNLTIHGICCTH